MKIIFLDIDGVLNAQDDFGGKSKPNPCVGGICGISRSKLRRLKAIVDATEAEIVLVSSWKACYEEYLRNYYLKDPNDRHGRYLYNKMRSIGLKIMDTTRRYNHDAGYSRGNEIISWLSDTKFDIESWIVLDDEIFSDYLARGIMPHLVKTTWDFGLTDEKKQEAIKKLNDPLNKSAKMVEEVI